MAPAVSFKMWPFRTRKEHIKHTLCSHKVLTEVRFMCRGLVQEESNAFSKMFGDLLCQCISVNTNVIA